MLWCSNMFIGTLVDIKPFGIIVSFVSAHNASRWTLVNVYGPCQGPPRDDFVQWLYNLDILVDDNWLLVGNFNFIRSLENRNLPEGDINDIFLFNEIIRNLGVLELPLKGRSCTWSNMQENPLLEQLDWFFTSTTWINDYPNTMVHPLARTASDHVPYVVSISTAIPKSKVFIATWTDSFKWSLKLLSLKKKVELETHSNNPGPRVSTFLRSPPRAAIGAPQSSAPHHSPSLPRLRSRRQQTCIPSLRPLALRRPSPAAPRSAAQVPIAELEPPLFLLLLLPRVGIWVPARLISCGRAKYYIYSDVNYRATNPF